MPQERIVRYGVADESIELSVLDEFPGPDGLAFEHWPFTAYEREGRQQNTQSKLFCAEKVKLCIFIVAIAVFAVGCVAVALAIGKKI